METRTALRWAGYYRAMATAAFFVGFGIVAVGAWLGFGETVTIVLEHWPKRWEEAIDAAQPLTAAGFTVVGLIVWQYGKAVAQVRTLSTATETEIKKEYNVEAVKSEVLASLEDRFADIEADVERNGELLDQINRERKAEELELDPDEADAGTDDAASRNREAAGDSLGSDAGPADTSGRGQAAPDPDDVGSGDEGGDGGGRDGGDSGGGRSGGNGGGGPR